MSEKPPPSLRSAAIWATVLYFIDSFIMNQGFIALLTIGAVSVYVLIAAMGSKDKTLLEARFAKAGLFFLAAVLVFFTNAANGRMARDRAEALIAACNQYHAKYKKYPDSLEDMVPEFIPSVPLAKYTLMHNSFIYSADPGGHSLTYVAMPPFGRRYYILE